MRERRRLGRTCLFHCNKIKLSTSSKCFNKVLHHVGKYSQNRSVHSFYNYFVYNQCITVFKLFNFQARLEADNLGTCLTHLEISLSVSIESNLLVYCTYTIAFVSLFTPIINAICFSFTKYIFKDFYMFNKLNKFNKPSIQKLCIKFYS